MTRKTSIHIVTRGDGWAVTRHGSTRAMGTFPDQGMALLYAEQVANRMRCDVYVHDADGNVRTRLRYTESPEEAVNEQ